MWGLRLGVWKFHVRAPPDCTEKKQKKKNLARKQPGRWFWWRETTTLRVSTSFFSFLFPFFQASHTRKRFFFYFVPPKGRKSDSYFSSLGFQGGAVVTYLPTYHHPFKPQQKSGIESRLPPSCIFFCLFFSFLSCERIFSDLVFDRGGRKTNGGSENLFSFLVCSIPYQYIPRRAQFLSSLCMDHFLLDWRTIGENLTRSRIEGGRWNTEQKKKICNWGMAWDLPSRSLDLNTHMYILYRLYFSWALILLWYWRVRVS